MIDSNLTNLSLQGRYEVQERIGTGGMARVYKAYDTNLERPVAIKLLHDHLADHATFKERFIREARFVASFNHPNIVQIYDFNVLEAETGILYYMVMPYIVGPTLKQMLAELAKQGQRMPHAQVLTIFRDLCDALNYAHGRGMIHRDVKPANILFDEHDRAVLTDFGIARLAESSGLTQEGFTAGTPMYMSPEQVSGLPADSRSDIYSLGIILFEMLAGTPPFTDDSGVSTMLKHVNAPVPRLADHLPDVNPVLDALIVRALAKNPDDRFETVNELANHLNATLGNESDLAFLPLVQSTKTAEGNHQTDVASTRILDLDTTNTNVSNSVIQRIKHYNSPRSILVLGVSAIILIAAIALIGNLSTPGADANAATEDTGVPSMTGETEDYVFSHFTPGESTNVYWPVDNTGTIKREITDDGFYRFRNERPGIAATTLLENEKTYTDALITLDGILETESARSSAYGIVFRYVDPDNYHVFAVDGSQRYSIWVRNQGNWRELRDETETWTFNNAINPLGSSNQIAVEIQGNTFVGSVNGTIVTEVTDDTITDGQVGIYLATTNSGMASTLIDSYTLETDLTAPSMTDDQTAS